MKGLMPVEKRILALQRGEMHEGGTYNTEIMQGLVRRGLLTVIYSDEPGYVEATTAAG